jgi:hypothetical protein
MAAQTENKNFVYQADNENVDFSSSNDQQGSQNSQQQQRDKNESNWGWVCNASAMQPEKCKLEMADPTVPPSYTGEPPVMAELQPAKQ